MAEGGGEERTSGTEAAGPESFRAPSGTRDVFISYVSQDGPVADAVVGALERAGLTCWIAPRDVVPGALDADEIVRAINEAKVVVLVLSEAAAASPHVGKEIERASSIRRRIVALRTDAASLPRAFEYLLSESHWIDVGSGGIEATAAKLVDAVRRHLAPVSTTEANVPLAPHILDRKVAAPRLRWVLLASAAVLAMALAYVFAGKLWVSKHVTADQQALVSTAVVGDKSIAVLPFTDMSDKKDQEYFADGIAEEVLDRLAKVPGLRVVGRTSSFQFKGKNTDPASIGAALGVAYLVEGSVRRGAGRVRVAAQLVDARTGSQRWSDGFDSDMIDIIHVQDTIAAELARALQIAVEVDTAPRSSVKSPEALDAYLRGLQSFSRSSREGCEAAVANFHRALALDPTFAPAAIGLARTYAFIGSQAWLPPRVAYERSREAALLALRLDPKSPTSHVSMAEIHTHHDWDWAGADRELKQAFALGPRESYGVQTAARLAAARGQWDEARQLALEAIELDPLDADAQGSPGFQIYLGSGDFAEAERSFRRALQIAPGWGAGQYFLGTALLLQGRHEAALTEYRKETLDDGELEGSAMVYFATGRKGESDAQLAEAIRHNGPSWPSEIARVYASRGEKDRAFEWLERAYDARDQDLYFIKGDPLLKKLDGDPRYKALNHGVAEKLQYLEKRIPRRSSW